MVGGTSPPIIFLTGKTNFRYHIAKRQKYKDRPSHKPFHYKNLTAYIKGKYEYRLTEGLEADDLIGIEQTNRPGEVVTCSRDKDLKTIPGIMYSWELGNQPSFGPEDISELGKIEYNEEKKKLTGVGGLFFYSQVLMGDPVDNIPGIPKIGPKKAFTTLFDCVCLEDAYNRVLGMYRHYYEDLAEEELLEQARLLHMTRVMDGEKILLWNPPNVQYKDWYDLNSSTIERTPSVQPTHGFVQLECKPCGTEAG